MNRLSRLAGVGLLVALTAGCGLMPLPTLSREETVRLGSSPPVNYKEAISSALVHLLKDSESARVQYGVPFRGASREGMFHTLKGWHVPTEINAKNAFGGYTGFEQFLFVFDESHELWVGCRDPAYESSFGSVGGLRTLRLIGKW